MGSSQIARSRRDFDNVGDTTDDIRQIFELSFQTVEVKVIRSVAHFTAQPLPSDPRKAPPNASLSTAMTLQA